MDTAGSSQIAFPAASHLITPTPLAKADSLFCDFARVCPIYQGWKKNLRKETPRDWFAGFGTTPPWTSGASLYTKHATCKALYTHQGGASGQHFLLRGGKWSNLQRFLLLPNSASILCFSAQRPFEFHLLNFWLSAPVGGGRLHLEMIIRWSWADR